MLVEPKLERRMYEVLKFQVGWPMNLLVLSRLVGVNTHFVKTSLICGGAACPACRAGLGAKYQGYVAVLSEAIVRLLRVTSSAAAIGEKASLFVPGIVLIATKERERRPLRLAEVREEVNFDPRAIVSRGELLNVVARLHGLAAVSLDLSIEEAEKVIAMNAVTTCGLALRGVAA